MQCLQKLRELRKGFRDGAIACETTDIRLNAQFRVKVGSWTGQLDHSLEPTGKPRHLDYTTVDPVIIVLEGCPVPKQKQQAVKGMIGRFIVADPAICHGQPTFRGTRILVADVLEQVAAGIAWETIVEEWRGSVCADAISEAVRLASQAFREHSGKYVVPEYVLQRVQV